MNKRMEKEQNLLRILESLRKNKPLTQARLKEICNLQASTVSYLVNELKSTGILLDGGVIQSGGKVGKPGSILCCNNAFASFLGFYLEDSWIDVYHIGLDGEILFFEQVTLNNCDVKAHLIQVITEHAAGIPSLKGIGVAVKAIVHRDGSIRSGHRLGAKEWDFSGLLEDLSRALPDIPIVVENDANCLAELYRHKYRQDCENLVVYLLHDIPFGIGCGLLLNGKIHRGFTGAAGEIFEKGARFYESSLEFTAFRDSTARFVKIVMPHMLQTAYLLDPEVMILTGNYFNRIQKEDLIQLQQILEALPMPAVITSGRDAMSPAMGAALLVTDQYVNSFVKEVMGR